MTSLVNEFFANINFHNADLRNTLVTPSTSFLIAEKSNAQIDGATFDGMRNNDQFVIGAGLHKNISLTHVDGGTITFSHGSTVEHLEISGLQASIGLKAGATVAHAKIRDGEDFRIVKFEGEPGAVLRDSDFGNATISTASRMQGMHIENVTFGNASYVSAQGATLKNVTINGDAKEAEFQANYDTGEHTKLHQLTINGIASANFSGAELIEVAINGDIKGAQFSGNITNLMVKGELITSEEQLVAMGATVTGPLNIENTKEAERADNQRIAMEKASQVRENAVSWIKETETALAIQQEKEPVVAVADEQTKAPFIGMPVEQQVQQGPMMAATNDNGRPVEATQEPPAELGQDRANTQAKDTNFEKVLWKDKAIASNGQSVQEGEVALQGNLKNNAPSTSQGIA